ARHLGEHPTLIGGLVGVAVAGMTVEPLEEMIGQPGCPNLYWALTNLPVPLVDSRKGIEAERIWGTHEFALLDEKMPMTDVEINNALAKISELIKYLDPPDQPKESVAEWLATRGK